MDFILPSDDAMELMRKEYAKLKTHADAFALSELATSREPLKNPSEDAPKGNVEGAYIGSVATAMLLLLYFVKHLGYNISYGTQIFNTHRGLEQIRPDRSCFGQLNDLD
ncbi:MAG: hypothetical protein NC037_05345 [Bacteroides sp.]|nr:hypothetical protein [Bacillota bacterium]MCM1394116.1 hypothetical protein [[Eubacterium] siraeum]MCM1455931.1 hypothetical protein [Bacteroides sp.]